MPKDNTFVSADRNAVLLNLETKKKGQRTEEHTARGGKSPRLRTLPKSAPHEQPQRQEPHRNPRFPPTASGGAGVRSGAEEFPLPPSGGKRMATSLQAGEKFSPAGHSGFPNRTKLTPAPAHTPLYQQPSSRTWREGQ